MSAPNTKTDQTVKLQPVDSGSNQTDGHKERGSANFNPVMQNYIYHFVGQTKKYLDQCRGHRTNPPELPYPWDIKANKLFNGFGDAPPRMWEEASCSHSDTIANLLAVFPEMRIQINQWSEQSPCQADEVKKSDRDQQFAATYTSYLNLSKLLLRLGPIASRISIASQDSLPESKIISNSLTR